MGFESFKNQKLLRQAPCSLTDGLLSVYTLRAWRRLAGQSSSGGLHFAAVASLRQIVPTPMPTARRLCFAPYSVSGCGRVLGANVARSAEYAGAIYAIGDLCTTGKNLPESYAVGTKHTRERKEALPHTPHRPPDNACPPVLWPAGLLSAPLPLRLLCSGAVRYLTTKE